MLALVPGGAEAEDGAAVRHVIERRGHLREDRRVAIGVAGDERAEAHRRRERGPGGEELPGLEQRTPRVAVERDEVIPGPERVESEAVDEERCLAELRPGGVLRREVDAPMRARPRSAGGYASVPVLA